MPSRPPVVALPAAGVPVRPVRVCKQAPACGKARLAEIRVRRVDHGSAAPVAETSASHCCQLGSEGGVKPKGIALSFCCKPPMTIPLHGIRYCDPEYPVAERPQPPPYHPRLVRPAAPIDVSVVGRPRMAAVVRPGKGARRHKAVDAVPVPVSMSSVRRRMNSLPRSRCIVKALRSPYRYERQAVVRVDVGAHLVDVAALPVAYQVHPREVRVAVADVAAYLIGLRRHSCAVCRCGSAKACPPVQVERSCHMAVVAS